MPSVKTNAFRPIRADSPYWPSGYRHVALCAHFGTRLTGKRGILRASRIAPLPRSGCGSAASVSRVRPEVRSGETPTCRSGANGQRTRVPELVPIRHGRMLVSPFTYFRGAALPMASDLAATPDSGVRVQLCGDAHLSNFGIFGSPERHLFFDVNDFDETAPGPWDGT